MLLLIQPPQNYNARLLQLLQHSRGNPPFIYFFVNDAGLVKICEREAASHRAQSERSM